MLVEIFDVEHGACALISTPEGDRIMVDCGTNTTTKWKPGDMLRQRGITALDMLVITNYDEDHVSGLINLRENVSIWSLLRNKNVSASQIKQLKSETGIGLGMTGLCDMISEYNGPAVSFSNGSFKTDAMSWEVASNTFSDFDDENNLSLIFSITLEGLTFTFCGDMETAGWQALDGPQLRQMLGKTNVLIAPHHGRQSGWWDGFMTHANAVQVVVISDHYIQYKSQQTQAWYASIASGVRFGGESRKVLTTRSDGTIAFGHDHSRWFIMPK